MFAANVEGRSPAVSTLTILGSEEDPVTSIVISSVPAVSAIDEPATRLLNSRSTPVFCLNTPSPAPTLDAVFTSPVPVDGVVTYANESALDKTTPSLTTKAWSAVMASFKD